MKEIVQSNWEFYGFKICRLLQYQRNIFERPVIQRTCQDYDCHISLCFEVFYLLVHYFSYKFYLISLYILQDDTLWG
ncbi:hypothetical protein BDZ94DRAFT_1277279 [Collybia nuda]|uniref:Uncharacterized protein n=1 Tax=Collybia nuda TaxID=64659 RepID=A0A9P5XSK8_9AGAR|nr:hypothetical protein BDZ94DRAFT_1277279 [Collybia nuda]